MGRGRKVLINWLIPRAYFLYIGTCLTLIGEFIFMPHHSLLLLTFASTSFSRVGDGEEGVNEIAVLELNSVSYK